MFYDAKVIKTFISANDYDFFLKIIYHNAYFICNFIVPLQCKLEIATQEMTDKIKHTGIIDSVEGDHIKVRILQISACASCKIASQCHTSESKEKLVDVYADSQAYTVGQQVTVVVSKNIAWRALALGFCLPFLLLLTILFAVYHFTGNEAVAALSSIGSLLPYYLIVWMMRDKISRTISFQIEA